MMRHWGRYWLVAATLGLGSCGPWQRVGSEPLPPDASTYVPRLFDLTSVYRDMGLLTADEPLPFVASVRFLAGPSPDVTMALVGLSLTNKALSFRRVGGVFEAPYRVEIAFRRDGRIIQRHAEDQMVRVEHFPETQRADESVVYQRFVPVPPGDLEITISVRDQNGTNYGQVEGQVVVPGFAQNGLSSLVPAYRAAKRSATTELPDLVVNPRATVPYGTDSLQFFLEVYDSAPEAVVTVRAFVREPELTEVWQDSVTVGQGGPLASLLLAVRPELLPMGELVFEATVSGGRDTAKTAILVAFSAQWAVANFDETLSLLRYFGQAEAIAQLRDAPPAERPILWHAFWRATDPNPRTPDHEALEIYFARLQEANELFRESADPGWLTDRGEVLITLGPPDEIFDSSSDLQDRGIRLIRWVFTSDRVTLDFVDDTGFGQFRLTQRSRADYMIALNRLRRGT
jgi:GWxTD domain-containing protein